MSAQPIEVEGLVKRFGDLDVLRGLSFKVLRGSVYGFLGRNGSGKTTTIRCLAGLNRRDGGTVSLFGRDPEREPEAILSRVGYVAENLALPETRSVGELDAFLGNLYPSWDRSYLDSLLGKLGVPKNRKISSFSLGQKRKAALAVALASRPELLILDEPAANLDPVVRREFLEELVGLLSSEGTTVFLSSHNLGDVERIADRVGILSEGKLLFQGETDAFKDCVLRVRVSFPGDPPASLHLDRTLRERVFGRELLATVNGPNEAQLAALRAQPNLRVEVQTMNLEDIFIELTREEGKEER